MSRIEQYRAKAAEYTEVAETATSPDRAQEFRKREQDVTRLADNEQWLTDNYDKTLHAGERREAGDVSLAREEEHILRCLGAALIMQWNTLPTKLKRELFDKAGTMGELLDTGTLRGQIARFVHKHKDGADEIV